MLAPLRFIRCFSFAFIRRLRLRSQWPPVFTDRPREITDLVERSKHSKRLARLARFTVFLVALEVRVVQLAEPPQMAVSRRITLVRSDRLKCQ
jgi:hypothetical protein